MQTPPNKVLLHLDKLYTDEIITQGGLKLYLDPTFRPEWNVTVSGTVAALPKEGIQGLKLGDKVYFSYHIVNEKKWEDDKQFFVRNKLGNEYVREWTNKLGGTIRMIAFPGAINHRWVGSYVNEYKEHTDGCQGTEMEVDNWMATNFKYGYSQSHIYKNLLEVDGKDYWIADTDSIFAVKRKKELQAMPGYAICKPLVIDKTTEFNILYGDSKPLGSVKLKPQDRGKIVTMGETKNGFNISAKNGDTVIFENRFVEKYVFDEKEYFIVKHKRILARV